MFQIVEDIEMATKSAELNCELVQQRSSGVYTWSCCSYPKYIIQDERAHYEYLLCKLQIIFQVCITLIRRNANSEI